MGQCDIGDVMTIVDPCDVRHTVRLRRKSHDLFDKCHHLHEDVVANSNTWHNRWVADDCMRENMVLTLMLLRNNTEPELWSKCMDKYKDYSPIQQGGPLMLCSLLRRIQNQSEQAYNRLKEKVRELKLNTLLGEDVELAVRLIKSIARVLKNASTPTRSYLPSDFIETVFAVMQTSSAPEFNTVFRTELHMIQVEADKTGNAPRWPPLSELLLLAKNTHMRLKHNNVWDKVSKRSRALTLQTNPRPAGNITCWNCGGNHHLSDCPKPRDQKKIDLAIQRYRAARRARGKPRHKTGSDGEPLVLNKNGHCVVDQKRWRARNGHVNGRHAPNDAPRPSVPTGSDGSLARQPDPEPPEPPHSAEERSTAMRRAVQRIRM